VEPRTVGGHEVVVPRTLDEDHGGVDGHWLDVTRSEVGP
jgi:hypothetical protein